MKLPGQKETKLLHVIRHAEGGLPIVKLNELPKPASLRAGLRQMIWFFFRFLPRFMRSSVVLLKSRCTWKKSRSVHFYKRTKCANDPPNAPFLQEIQVTVSEIVSKELLCCASDDRAKTGPLGCERWGSNSCIRCISKGTQSPWNVRCGQCQISWISSDALAFLIYKPLEGLQLIQKVLHWKAKSDKALSIGCQLLPFWINDFVVKIEPRFSASAHLPSRSPRKVLHGIPSEMKSIWNIYRNFGRAIRFGPAFWVRPVKTNSCRTSFLKSISQGCHHFPYNLRGWHLITKWLQITTQS